MNRTFANYRSESERISFSLGLKQNKSTKKNLISKNSFNFSTNLSPEHIQGKKPFDSL